MLTSHFRWRFASPDSAEESFDKRVLSGCGLLTADRCSLPRRGKPTLCSANFQATGAWHYLI
jgi:hypothetical protein